MKKEGREKIGYPFVAFPKALCTTDNFRSPQFLVFLLWIFSRLSFETQSRFLHGKFMILEEGEFLFGRKICSDETGLSEQTIRTHLKKLTASKILQKVTSKSTNKFTVYKAVRERFNDFVNQQINPQVTSNQPATNHNQDIKNKEEEQQQRKECAPTAAAAAFLEGKAKKQFNLLPQHEREAIVALYHQRLKTQAITNPEAWFIKCCEEHWHLEEKLVFPEPPVSDFEKNKAHAAKLVQQLESSPDLHICLRSDFLELGHDKCRQWQIFFSEVPKAFLEQIDLALKKIQI